MDVLDDKLKFQYVEIAIQKIACTLKDSIIYIQMIKIIYYVA